MHCPRCKGMMVVDHFIDMADDTGHLWLRAWRCILCGNVVDPAMERHRRSRLAQVIGKFSRKSVETDEVVELGV
jgi:uncharacterized Fe-S cluster-containing MiaB family protein